MGSGSRSSAALVRVLLVAVVALVLGACGAPVDPAAGEAATTPESVLSPSTPKSVADRCKLELDPALDVRPQTFPAASGGELKGAVVGEGPVVAVYLHETGAAGICGWVPFASWAAARGVRGVLLDLCGWGVSDCEPTLEGDVTAQVRAGVDWARSAGATSVTVVGASMGASMALGVGQAAGADAVVALSGPDQWPGVPDAVPAGKATTVPLLVAAADGDPGIDRAALRQAVRESPATTKRYVAEPGLGHGYTLLDEGTTYEPAYTPLATTVVDWVNGRYAASS